MRAKISNIEDLADWLDGNSAIVDYQVKSTAISNFENLKLSKLPTPMLVLLRTVIPIAIAAIAIILVFATEGIQKYFYLSISLSAIAWFVLQFVWLHNKRKLSQQ